MPAIHEWVITGAYGILSLKILADVLTLKRIGPSKDSEGPLPTILIAGSNKESWLAASLQVLKAEGFRVYYYDLESSDHSVETARSQGVTVLTGRPPDGADPALYANYRLALAASEDSPDEWWVFAPMGPIPLPGLGLELKRWIKREGGRHSHLYAIPKLADSSLIDLTGSIWGDWLFLMAFLSRVDLSIDGCEDSEGVPFGGLHVWRGARCIEEVYGSSNCPDRHRSATLMPRTSFGTVILHGLVRKSRVIGLGSYPGFLFAVAFAWSWLVTGPLWPVALVCLLLTYLATALTSRNTLKALAVLPASVAIAPGLMLRNHFIRYSKRNKR